MRYSALLFLCVVGFALRAGPSSARVLTQSLSTDIKYVTGSDPKGQPVEIAPGTVWLWCGFNGMKKLSVTVTATGEISMYIAPKKVAKTATLANMGVPGYDTCKGTTCTRSASGKIIDFNRCIGVGNYAEKTAVKATVTAKTSNDGRISGIIAGVVILCVAVVACCIISWVCCLKNTLCCCC